MKISAPQLKLKPIDNKVRIQANIEYNNHTKWLWFEVDKKYQDFLVLDRCDGFAAALLSSAMTNNESLQVEGTLSRKLYDNLKFYMSAINPFYPGLNIIEIHPHRLTSKRYPSGFAVGASFMMTSDSLQTIQRHFNSIKYLICANWGAYPRGKSNTRSFKQGVQQLKDANDRYLHKKLIIIDSNIDTFIDTVPDPEVTYGTAQFLVSGSWRWQTFRIGWV